MARGKASLIYQWDELSGRLPDSVCNLLVEGDEVVQVDLEHELLGQEIGTQAVPIRQTKSITLIKHAQLSIVCSVAAEYAPVDEALSLAELLDKVVELPDRLARAHP